jgi:hypothetical protein
LGILLSNFAGPLTTTPFETRWEIRTLIRIKTGRGVSDCGEYCQAAGTIAQHLMDSREYAAGIYHAACRGLLPLQHSEMKSRPSDQAADARMRRGEYRQAAGLANIGFDVDQISPDPDVINATTSKT